MLPRVFIASSTESLEIANEIQCQLDYNAECTVWKDNVFDLSKSSLQSLISALDSFDFAIFIFSPDDITSIRGKEHQTVRDNVVFEMGLFVGRLGANRVFCVKPRSCETLHLPTDISGITIGDFNDDRTDGNLLSALNPFCTRVRENLNKIGCVKIHTQTANIESNSQSAASYPVSNSYKKKFDKKMPQTFFPSLKDMSPLDRAMYASNILKLNEASKLFKYAKECMKEKKIDRAITAFEKGLIIIKKDADAFFHLALCYLFQEKYNKAENYKLMLHNNNFLKKADNLSDIILAHKQSKTFPQDVVHLFGEKKINNQRHYNPLQMKYIEELLKEINENSENLRRHIKNEYNNGYVAESLKEYFFKLQLSIKRLNSMEINTDTDQILSFCQKFIDITEKHLKIKRGTRMQTSYIYPTLEKYLEYSNKFKEEINMEINDLILSSH